MEAFPVKGMRAQRGGRLLEAVRLAPKTPAMNSQRCLSHEGAAAATHYAGTHLSLDQQGQQQQPLKLAETQRTCWIQELMQAKSHKNCCRWASGNRGQGYSILAALLQQRLTWASTHRSCCRWASGHKGQGSLSWQHASTLAAAASKAEMSTPCASSGSLGVPAGRQ